MERQKDIALKKIKSLYGTAKGEFGPTLFISHHLEEISEADWMETLKIKKPTPTQILEALTIVDEWSSNDDGIVDTFDFSLPNNLTNYLLSVRFSKNGNIEDVSMES